jgi:hypothetical protein
MTVVPGNYERSLSQDMQTANVITALKKRRRNIRTTWLGNGVGGIE